MTSIENENIKSIANTDWNCVLKMLTDFMEINQVTFQNGIAFYIFMSCVRYVCVLLFFLRLR